MFKPSVFQDIRWSVCATVIGIHVLSTIHVKHWIQMLGFD